MAAADPPDVLHLNDWHTGTALAALDGSIPSVLSLHNLAYQGLTDGSWLGAIGPRASHFEWYGGTNALSGAIALADAVVAVSPTYAKEIMTAGGWLRARRCAPPSVGRAVRDPQRDRHDDLGPGDGPRAAGPILGVDAGRRARSRPADESGRGVRAGWVRPGRSRRRRAAGGDGDPADRTEGRRSVAADRARAEVDPPQGGRARLGRGGVRGGAAGGGGQASRRGSHSSPATTTRSVICSSGRGIST